MPSFKQLNRTFATREVGSRRAQKQHSSSLFIFPVLWPFPKICLNPSLRQHQSLQQSPRNIHSPFLSLFFPRCFPFGSLYMVPTLSAWPQGKTHIWAEYHGYSSAVSSLFFHRTTKWRQPVNDWADNWFQLCFYRQSQIRCRPCVHELLTERTKNTVQPPAASHRQFLYSAAGPAKQITSEFKFINAEGLLIKWHQ